MAPIKSVAVIGSGISGVSTAAHLLRHGFEVVVFERSSVAGGVWHFDPRADRDPEYPSQTTSDAPRGAVNGADQVKPPSTTEKFEADDITLSHAPPGPCYEGLMNNVPTTLMRSSLLKWPEGTPEHVTHHDIEAYVQRLSRETGAQDVTLFDTRVEEAVKNGDKWSVRTKTLYHNDDGFTLEEKQWTFDALVVAAGHYHVPLIPEVPGLSEWKRKYPGRVMHSKGYRYPTAFKDQNILIIGAGVSSLDISKELEGIANKVYQSSRGGKFDLDPAFLPANSERVSGLEAFKLDEGTDIDGTETPGTPIPGTVHLTDGRILSDIHHVIIASGYQTTYPFLKGLESDTLPVDEADDKIIITADKTVTHNLHKDIFYIPDPTLTFVGVPYYTSTFSMFDFQAEVVARVYAGLAELPSKDLLRAEHAARKAQGEKGKAFHSLINNQVGYMNEVLAWVNDGVEEKGIEKMRGVDDDWYKSYEEFKAKSRRLIPPGSEQIQQPIASKYYTPGK
ncbi:hypothetical protein SLS53_007217 [Cytospora paraplurivora]|uniref:Uncharacterized protein n=1 Tax=Cytospora paraplurivora TaxID=2898453 RepID=A0AAN9YDC5_9PEZI